MIQLASRHLPPNHLNAGRRGIGIGLPFAAGISAGPTPTMSVLPSDGVGRVIGMPLRAVRLARVEGNDAAATEDVFSRKNGLEVGSPDAPPIPAARLEQKLKRRSLALSVL